MDAEQSLSIRAAWRACVGGCAQEQAAVAEIPGLAVAGARFPCRELGSGPLKTLGAGHGGTLAAPVHGADVR